jgi:hypothetical protein
VLEEGLWLDAALSPNKTREVIKLIRKKIEFFTLNLLFDDWILMIS